MPPFAGFGALLGKLTIAVAAYGRIGFLDLGAAFFVRISMNGSEVTGND